MDSRDIACVLRHLVSEEAFNASFGSFGGFGGRDDDDFGMKAHENFGDFLMDVPVKLSRRSSCAGRMNYNETTEEEKKAKKKKKKNDRRESTGKSGKKEKGKQEKSLKNDNDLAKMQRRSSCGPGYSAAKAQLSAFGTSASLQQHLNSSSESFGTVSTFASSVSGSSQSPSVRRRQQRRLSCPCQTYISITTVEIISENAGIKW
jgi:hypothetical protein